MNLPAPAPSPRPADRLWTPRLALGACVRGVMARDTRGAGLPEAQRFNHFPATPMSTISWWLSGTSERLPPGAAADLAVPRTPIPADIVFAGPRGGPSVTWNPGHVHSLTLVLPPDALRLLTGIDPQAWTNRWAAARDVLPPDWVDMCERVRAARDDEARVRLMQDFLEPRWDAARPPSAFGFSRYRDWVHALALRAGMSASGRSVRQVERRIKEWTGQPMRELRGASRSEQAFFEAVLAQGEDRLRWADVAASAGFADQSHLCRETRRVSGFAPEELRRRIRSDESFWAYRIWR